MMTRESRVRVFAALLMAMACSAGCLSPALPPPPTASPRPRPSAVVASITRTMKPTLAATPSPSTPFVLGSVTILDLPGQGHAPRDMAVLDGRIYVANVGSANVSVIEDGRVVAVIPVGPWPLAVTADPITGRVFVLDSREYMIAVLKGETLVDRWPVPVGSSSLAVIGGALWVGSGDGRLVELSTVNGATLGDVVLSEPAPVLRIVGNPDNAARAAAVTYGRVHLVALDSAVETAVAEMGIWQALAYAPGGERLYAGVYDASANAHRLLVLDGDSLDILDEVDLPGSPRAILADPASGQIHVALADKHAVVTLSETLMPAARMAVGREPVALALDAGVLHIACSGSDQVVRVDAANGARLGVVPLAARIPALAVSSFGVLTALSSADEIVVLGDDGVMARWCTEPHPSRLAVLPEQQVAILSSAAGILVMHGSDGTLASRYAVGPEPKALYHDDQQGLLYAGRLALNLATGVTHTVAVTTPMGSVEWPVQVAVDSRRDVTYIVASNGVPGSNHGLIAYRMDTDGTVPGGPGRLSIVDLLHDAETDLFFGTYQRMGTYGLQVWDPATGSERLSFSLSRRPTAMALNPSTHHLWVALGQGTPLEPATDGLLRVYDTRTMGLVAELAFRGPIVSLAVDVASNRVYAACEVDRAVWIIQDVSLPSPPAPTLTVTPSPWPTLTPTP